MYPMSGHSGLDKEIGVEKLCVPYRLAAAVNTRQVLKTFCLLSIQSIKIKHVRHQSETAAITFIPWYLALQLVAPSFA
jgi:hypothetical protein